LLAVIAFNVPIITEQEMTLPLVKFKKPWKIYSPGDTTRPEQETADALVQSGHAVILNEDATEPEPAADGKDAAGSDKKTTSKK
jgi:hypothetical protein